MRELSRGRCLHQQQRRRSIQCGHHQALVGQTFERNAHWADTPSLRDVWATGPYLHDGSAATIGTAISAHTTLTLTASDLSNVIAFVQQIGSEEPAANAVRCASEYATCNLPSGLTTTVYYGAYGKYTSKTGVRGSIGCGNSVFGDPYYGYGKACYYLP